MDLPFFNPYTIFCGNGDAADSPFIMGISIASHIDMIMTPFHDISITSGMCTIALSSFCSTNHVDLFVPHHPASPLLHLHPPSPPAPSHYPTTPSSTMPTTPNISSDGKPGRTMKVHTGNLLDCPDEFDYTFFKVSPREARSMDPQQIILLHTAHDALENAGYVPDATLSFRRDTFGCGIGTATHDYADNLWVDIDLHHSPGM